MNDRDGAGPRLCVFLKAPVPGQVKSRLAVHLGPHKACEAYKMLVEHCLGTLSSCPLPKDLWVAGGLGHPRVQAWAEQFGFGVLPQPDGGLGEKMLAAIKACCRSGHSGLVVGADLPTLDGGYVGRAAAALAHQDVVLAPAEDGGYGLIGLNAPVAELFTDMPWGTGAVLAQTRARIARLGLKLAELPPLWDVDDIQGWRRFQAFSPHISPINGWDLDLTKGCASGAPTPVSRAQTKAC